MPTPALVDPVPDSTALLAAFVEERRARHHAPGTLEQASQVLPRFFAWLERHGIDDVRTLEEADLVAYARSLARQKAKRSGRPFSLATRAVHLGNVKTFFSFLERRGVILANPAREVKVPRVDRLPGPVLSQVQVRRLLHTPAQHTLAGTRDRAILETLYGTAIRIGECARLDMTDLDLLGRTLLVRNGKGRKDRMVPIPGKAAEALDAYVREVRPGFVHDGRESALFLSRVGMRLKSGSLYVLVKGHARAAGLVTSPHGLRHACATHLLAHGADVTHVQALLGHSQLQTTMIYTRVDVEALRQALARAHPRL